MGFLANFLKSSLTKKCPKGYKVGGVTEEGIIYYEKIEKDGGPKKLSTVEKERIMVQRIIEEDMLQFPDIPYQLNSPIHKQMAENGNPFAYIDLNEYNQSVAKRDLKMVNRLIVDAQKYIKLLSGDFSIRIERIAFKQYSPDYGYTKIICTPYTFTGKVSKYPIYLSFMSKMNTRTYSVSGELYYEKDGHISKGTVNIWREQVAYSGGTGWLFKLKEVDKKLTIIEAKTNLRPDKYGQPAVVYKRK